MVSLFASVSPSRLLCRFEKMAESCKKSLEVLRLAQSRGLPPPKHHFEERSFHTVRYQRLSKIMTKRFLFLNHKMLFFFSHLGYFQSWAALTWLLLSSKGWIFLPRVVKQNSSFISCNIHTWLGQHGFTGLTGALNDLTFSPLKQDGVFHFINFLFSGIQPNDLDAYVKFDFPYPSTVRGSRFPCQAQQKSCSCTNLWCVAFRTSLRNTRRLSSRTPTVQVESLKNERVFSFSFEMTCIFDSSAQVQIMIKCTFQQGCPDPVTVVCLVEHKTWLDFSPQELALDAPALHHLTECWPAFGFFLFTRI